MSARGHWLTRGFRSLEDFRRPADGLDGSPATPQNRSVRRIGSLIGAILVLIGMFWAGRESSHGFGALWEHWWCPIPIVAIVVGLATAWLLARRPTQAA